MSLFFLYYSLLFCFPAKMIEKGIPADVTRWPSSERIPRSPFRGLKNKAIPKRFVLQGIPSFSCPRQTLDNENRGFSVRGREFLFPFSRQFFSRTKRPEWLINLSKPNAAFFSLQQLSIYCFVESSRLLKAIDD